MAIVLGTDVSWWQGTVDWAAVGRTSYRFGICRMTRGSGSADETGHRNLRGILDHLPVAGGYGVVGTADPVGSAKRFVDEVGAVVDPAKVVLMLDAERFADGTGPSRNQINAYAKQIHADIGRWPVAYVPDWYLDWLATKGDGDGTVRGLELANCPWAPSEYFPAPWTETKLLANKPTDLRGFHSLAWLQYTSSATIAGISGNADANCHYGTLTQLRAQLLGQQEDDMTQEEHDALMAMASRVEWLRSNVAGLKDQTIRGLDHGDQTTIGSGNHHAAIRADIAAVQADVATIKTALAAGTPVTLTQDQLDQVTAALQRLEGSALIQLAISPAAV